MIDKEKQRWLEWFVDLINFDYDSASKSERFEVAAKLMFTLAGYSKFGMSEPGSLSPEDLWHAVGKTDHLPAIGPEGLISSLRKLFHEIVENAQIAKDTGRLGDPSYEIKRFRDVTLSIRVVTTETEDGPSYRIVLEGVDEEESLRFHLLQLLDGVPLSIFRRCPECGAWFVHTSKREKIYCSARCAARNATRKSRERLKSRDPKRYAEMLKKGAQRARKSYVKRVQEEYPNAKVESRPRKYRRRDKEEQG